MYCENCGEEIPEDALFCPNCGHNLKHYRYSKITLFLSSIKDFIFNFHNRYARWSGGKRVAFWLSLIVVVFIVADAGALIAIMHMENTYTDTYDDTYDDYSTSVSQDFSDDDVSYSEDSSSDVAETTSTVEESSSDYSDSQDSSAGYDSSDSYGSYVASSKSDKFHVPSCRYVDNIKSGNLISFSSRDDAISSGYSPCKVCSP